MELKYCYGRAYVSALLRSASLDHATEIECENFVMIKKLDLLSASVRVKYEDCSTKWRKHTWGRQEHLPWLDNGLWQAPEE